MICSATASGSYRIRRISALEWMRYCWQTSQPAKKVAEERDSFSEFLRERGWFVIPSSTNFIFVKKDGRSAEESYRKIKQAGILVRHFSTPGIENFLRITIGTREQMSALRQVMEQL